MTNAMTTRSFLVTAMVSGKLAKVGGKVTSDASGFVIGVECECAAGSRLVTSSLRASYVCPACRRLAHGANVWAALRGVGIRGLRRVEVA